MIYPFSAALKSAGRAWRAAAIGKNKARQDGGQLYPAKPRALKRYICLHIDFNMDVSICQWQAKRIVNACDLPCRQDKSRLRPEAAQDVDKVNRLSER